MTASTGSGTGTLGLNLIDDDSIVDASTTPLGGPVPATATPPGRSYSLDLSRSVGDGEPGRSGQADPTNVSPVGFTVVFGESVSDFTAQ